MKPEAIHAKTGPGRHEPPGGVGSSPVVGSILPKTPLGKADIRNPESHEPARTLFPGRMVLYVEEVARHLRVTKQHVLRLIEDGSLSAINVNGAVGKRNCWRIPVEAYQAFLKQRGS